MRGKVGGWLLVLSCVDGWLLVLSCVDGTLACVHGQANGLILTDHPGHNEVSVISLGDSSFEGKGLHDIVEDGTIGPT